MRIPVSSKARPGATMVESVFVILIALTFMFGIFEYGRFVMTRQIMENAAREGARYAAVHTNNATVADIQNQVDSKLSAGKYQLTDYNKTTSIQVFAADATGNPVTGVNWNDGAFGTQIGVSITGTYKPSLPNLLFWKTSFTLTTRSVMASEAN